MTDVYDLTRSILEGRSGSARARVITSFEDDPEKAARAVKLGEATGVPPEIISTDLEGFEREHKATLSSSLIDNNTALQAFIDTSPMAAKVAHDDIGELDATSQSASNMYQRHLGLPKLLANIISAPASINEGFWRGVIKGAREGYGEWHIGAGALSSESGKKLAQDQPLAASLFAAGASPFELALRLGGGFIGAVAGGAHGAATASAKQVMSTQSAERFGRDIGGMAEQYFQGQMFIHHGVSPHSVEKLRAEMKPLEPWINAGVEPPAGLHPLVDQIKKERAEADLEALSDVIKDAQASKLKERSQDLFATFLRQHEGWEDQRIGIPFDVVAELYGSKLPEPNDGILGWVPRLREQAETAATTGGDILVPAADFVAKIDSKVWAQIKDHVRVRSEGLTKFEGDNLQLPEKRQTVPPAPVYAVRLVNDNYQVYKISDNSILASITYKNEKQRATALGQANALRNDMNEQARKTETSSDRRREVDTVQAVRQVAGLNRPEFTLKLAEKTASGRMAYDILDKDSKSIGELYLAPEDGGKTLYVDDMRSEAGPQSLGPRTILQILRQLAQEHPEVKQIKGLRVSGAREKAGEKYTDMVIDLDRFRPLDLGKFEAAKEALKVPPEPTGPPTTKATQLELPETTRMEDREIFEKSSAMGMTVVQYRRYMNLIEKQQAEDYAYALKRAEREQKRRQTQEWKEAEATERIEAVKEVQARPEVAADRLFRDQVLYSDKVPEPVRLSTDYLTQEQQDALPKSYVAKRGAHPDDIAQLLGFATGKDMVEALIAHNEARKTSGMRAIDFERRLIEVEIERRMQERFGDLKENILAEAKDQALSETQQMLLYEEVLALAEKNKVQLPIPSELNRWLNEKFNELYHDSLHSDKLLAEAGKAGRAVEEALLKQDYAEAFRQRQRQYNAIYMAKLAQAFEKEKAAFEKVQDRFIGREPNKRIDRVAWDFGQQLLSDVGVWTKRLPEEIADSISRSGFKDFDAYVESKIGDGWEMEVPDYIRMRQNPNVASSYRLPQLEQMTVEQWRDFSGSLEALYNVGRAEQLINVGGEKRDFVDFKREVLTNITSLPIRNPDKPMRFAWKIDAYHVKMEEIMKDLDLREDAGPLFEAVIAPLADAKHSAYVMQEKLVKQIEGLRVRSKEWVRSLDDTINQDFFFDPYYDNGVLFELKRSDMINIMLNFGNRSNIEKFTRGYGSPNSGRIATKAEAAAFEGRLWKLIHDNASKEDWQFVQSIWNLFKQYEEPIKQMYYELGGRHPKMIKPDSITTPHGTFDGGYVPIQYDRMRSNINVLEERAPLEGGRFNQNYFRAITANSYIKERTNYFDRIAFNLSVETIAMRLQQTIHDISHRRAVIDVNKVIYDKQIRAAIRKHYGSEYEARLDSWINDVATQHNVNEKGMGELNNFMRRFRYNLVSHVLGLNLKVILSPDVGLLNPTTIRNLWNYGEASKLAYEKSREIPHTFRNMDRDYREGLERMISTSGIEGLRASAVRGGFWPVVKVSQAFRVSTFVKEYKRAIEDGKSEGQAVSIADSAVRSMHGSGAVMDLPQVMRGNEAMKTMTMFMGFFNTMYNWQRQIPGQLRRGEYLKALETTYGAVIIPSFFGAVLFNKAVKDDSYYWKTWAKAIGMQLASTLVFARDLSNYIAEGFRPGSPISTALQYGGSAYTDIKRYSEGKKVEKPIQHGANVVGMATGLPLAQVGRTSQFGYDVYTNKQRPRNILEWTNGIIQGEVKPKGK